MWFIDIRHRGITIASENGFKSEAHCLSAIAKMCNNPAFDGLTMVHYFERI